MLMFSRDLTRVNNACDIGIRFISITIQFLGFITDQFQSFKVSTTYEYLLFPGGSRIESF